MVGIVGPAETFISYAQAGKWGDLVTAVADGAMDLQRRVLDVFAVRQWPSDNPDLDFVETIKKCNSLLVVNSYVREIESVPWGQADSRHLEFLPLAVRKQITFLRVWCLVELHAAAYNNKTIVFKAGSFRENFEGKKEFYANNGMLLRLVSLIDIQYAEATVESDKAQIFKRIREDGIGILELNRIVRGIISGALGATQDQYACTVHSAVCGDAQALTLVLSNPSVFLGACASGGFVDLLDVLMTSYVDVDVEIDRSALLNASRGGHLQCIETLMKHGASVNVQDDNGWTPVMLSSRGGYIYCVKTLISYGADLNLASCKDGKTALWAATSGGHVDCVTELILHGADVSKG